jgi:DNA-binding transcriptional LysR family regulator
MDLRQLRSFLAIAEELHFRRAALRVGLTQPALSQHVTALEAELDVRLFDRTRRKVELTSAGRIFSERIYGVVQALAAAVEETRRHASATQRVRTGYIDYINLPFLGPLFRRMQEKHPEIAVEHHEMYTDAALVALGEHAIDVAFALLPVRQPTFAYRVVVEGHWAIILPEGHALAALDVVPLEALAGEQWIMFDKKVNPPLRERVMARCASVGFTPRILYSTTQAHTGADLVAQGLGCFLAGSYVFRNLPPGVVSRRVRGLDERLQLAVVWHADDRSAATRAFLSVLREVAPTPPKPVPLKVVRRRRKR